eukprot:Tamp_10803.p1 GENE.Tamp_10803~~Tamp_10803.p1  ORF type:complete len:559 (+),score=61.57 Tamp_10803:142-1818(+)
MWLNNRGVGQQQGQQGQQGQQSQHVPNGGQVPSGRLGNLSQVPGGNRSLGAFAATGAAQPGSASVYQAFDQGNLTALVPGYSHGQSLVRTQAQAQPSSSLQTALQPQPQPQLYRLVPVEQHDLTGLGVAANVEPHEALYQLSHPPVPGSLHQGIGAGQVRSWPGDMSMLSGLVVQTSQSVPGSFMPVLGGGTSQLQPALGGSAQRGQTEEQHPGLVSLVLGQMPLHLQMPGVHSLQQSSGVGQFPLQAQQQTLFAAQGGGLSSSIFTHAQQLPGQDDASFPPGSADSSAGGHEGGASHGGPAASQRQHTSQRSYMAQSRSTSARGLADTPQYSGRRKPWKIALTPDQAKHIYIQRPQNSEFMCSRSAALAEQYNVNPKTIRDIWNRTTWVKATQAAWTRTEFIEWKKMQQEIARVKGGRSRKDISTATAGHPDSDDEEENAEKEGAPGSTSPSPGRYILHVCMSMIAGPFICCVRDWHRYALCMHILFSKFFFSDEAYSGMPYVCIFCFRKIFFSDAQYAAYEMGTGMPYVCTHVRVGPYTRALHVPYMCATRRMRAP